METTASADPRSSSLIDRLSARLHVSQEFLKFLIVGGIACFINKATPLSIGTLAGLLASWASSACIIWPLASAKSSAV